MTSNAGRRHKALEVVCAGSVGDSAFWHDVRLLEVVQGATRDRRIALDLAKTLREAEVEGTLYLGYPVLASSEEPVHIDALLVSRPTALRLSS